MNNHLYNGGSELNDNSGWYETFFRGYDAELGRFLQVDPLAGMSPGLSPYNFAFNSPVVFNDPNGDYPSHVEQVWADAASWTGYRVGGGRVGPGSANHWSDSYNSFNGAMSIYQFLDNVSHSRHGGFWQNGQSRSYNSEMDALEFASANPGLFPTLQLPGRQSEHLYRWRKKNGSNVRFKYLGVNEDARQGGAFQEWTPEYVNGVFGGSFDRKFGRLTSISFATEMTPEQVVAKLQSNLRNAKTHNDFYYLMPDESNPIVALRPIKYQIRIGESTTETLLVDPATINGSKIWGNPGTIDTSTGAPTPILYKVSDYQNSTVINIYLTVFFQSPFQGN